MRKPFNPSFNPYGPSLPDNYFDLPLEDNESKQLQKPRHKSNKKYPEPIHADFIIVLDEIVGRFFDYIASKISKKKKTDETQRNNYESDQPSKRVIIPLWMKDKVKRRAHYHCEYKGCNRNYGSGAELEYHHINGDRSDTRIDNLKYLCQHHHQVEDAGVRTARKLLREKRID